MPLPQWAAWTHANYEVDLSEWFEAFYWEVDDDGPWFSDSEGFVVLRNCPDAPTYSLDRIGHFCEDMSIVNKSAPIIGAMYAFKISILN